jgi:hypothetical protein
MRNLCGAYVIQFGKWFLKIDKGSESFYALQLLMGPLPRMGILNEWLGIGAPIQKRLYQRQKLLRNFSEG